jgi:NADPH-dependent curcumin reductase CurA
VKNRQVVLKQRPNGIPAPQHFEAVTADIELTPAEGQIAVKNLYLSIDPAMRGWVSLEENYLPPVQIGEVMRSVTVGEVVASAHPNYRTGDIVYGLFGWQQYAVTEVDPLVRKVDPELAPISTALGALGPNGLTALLVLEQIGKVQPGQTVLISTAAGGVGSIAGQIAKLKGARCIGLTGSDEKRALCTEEFGYDIAINYKTSADLAAEIREAAPEGIHFFFDNTSGTIADAVYPSMAQGGRVAQVGTAAIASWDELPMGPRRDRFILTKRLTIQGFVMLDYFALYPDALKSLAGWYQRGELNYRESITEGLENAPLALTQLYEGTNTGKQLVKI